MEIASHKPILISVVIITWNRKRDILETIQAVYNQDYKHFELIVVDNGSMDGTVEAIKQGYPNVKLIALDDNLGVTRSRNMQVLSTILLFI